MGIRVLHCDDSEAFTRLVAFWLAEHDDIEHVGEAHTAEAALAAEVLERIGRVDARARLA